MILDLLAFCWHYGWIESDQCWSKRRLGIDARSKRITIPELYPLSNTIVHSSEVNQCVFECFDGINGYGHLLFIVAVCNGHSNDPRMPGT
jgi:hypothetical protein